MAGNQRAHAAPRRDVLLDPGPARRPPTGGFGSARPRYNRAVSKPPTIADLTWTGELKFSATINRASLVVDSAGVAGPSPVEALAAALAGCMATDVVYILTRGRHPLRALRAHFVGHRAQEDPHRFVRIELAFAIDGDVPGDAVDRAIALSHEKYCSVWHSMRHDIDFTVRWSREPSAP
jgi:putative redox protein